MRTLTLVAALGVCLAIAGCSKSTENRTGQDLKAVGSDAAAAAKDVADAPAAKDLGADIKQGTQEAADKTKVAADEAGAKLKVAAQKAGADIKSDARDAAAKTDAAVDKAKDKIDH